jgi:hypothetical protein
MADVFGSNSAGAYHAPGTVTGSNPNNFTQTPKPPFLGGTGVNHNQLTDVYNPSDAYGNDLTADSFSHHAALPHQPNKAVYGRDVYKHLGMPGEAYLDNSTGTQTSDTQAPPVSGGPATLPPVS